MVASVNSLKYALKTLWPQKRIYNEVYPDHPFLALIKKNEDFTGENMYCVVRTGDPQGRSATFSTAQTISALTGAGNAGASRGVRFLLTRAHDYQIVNLEQEVILASKNDEGALVRALDVEMKAGSNNIGKSLAVSLFRGQTGVISTIGTITANTTVSADILLANINDVTSFEIGMLLVSSATATGANRATPASAYVSAVNRDTGVVRVLGDFSSTNWAIADSLFASGDNANNDGLGGNKVSGLADWIPSSTPSATTFFGVDRSVDPTRLAGLRIDASALTPEEGMTLALSRLDREGGRPTKWMTNHADYRNIAIALGSKAETKYQAVGDIGFESLQVRGPKGLVDIMADQDCPQGRAYALDMRTWTLKSLGGAPMIADMDGNQLSRVYNADQFEARLMYYAQLQCEAPGYNATVTLPT